MGEVEKGFQPMFAVGSVCLGLDCFVVFGGCASFEACYRGSKCVWCGVRFDCFGSMCSGCDAGMRDGGSNGVAVDVDVVLS